MYDVLEFQFNPNECWFRTNCDNYKNIDICNCGCSIYCQMYYLMNLANIPKRLQYAENQILNPGNDVRKYEYLEDIKDNIEEWVAGGNNLYLYSNHYGNGKTTWAIKLMCKYFSRIWDGNGTRCRGLFINVDDFLMQKKKQISTANQRIADIEELIPTVDLVIWDDIGCTKLNDYSHNILFPLINSRYINGKANIFTSNVIDEELVQNVGGRISSRVLESSQVVEFTNTSGRFPKEV